MREKKQAGFNRRFSITDQYGVAGWVVLAAIVAIGCALVAVSAAPGNVDQASVHGTAARSAVVVCPASAGAFGAADQVAFFDDALRQMSLCE